MNTFEILKVLSYILSFMGISDLWHEDDLRCKSIIKIIGKVIFGVLFIFSLMEFLVMFFGEYPQMYIIQAETLGITHILILIKPITIIYQSKTVKILNRDMIKFCQKYENVALYKKQFTMIRNTTILYCFIVYSTILFYVINALKSTISLGECKYS